MDNILDKLWESIEVLLINAISLFDLICSPLEIFGPGFVIFILSVFVVLLTRGLSRLYVTKRHSRLEQDFLNWKDVREEAMGQVDRDKGKTLAKNIDQAHLNKAYYDYFFEGFMKSLVTNILPILLMAGYITKVYTPENLFLRFGDKWVFASMNINSLLWFIICLVFSFFLFFILQRVFKLKYGEKKPT